MKRNFDILDRVKIKSRLGQETLEYVEVLEKISYAAIELWKVSPNGDKRVITEKLNNLYDALERVYFMDKEENEEEE